MYRAIPKGNRLCAKREQDRCADIHAQKLKEVKCTVDFSEPKSLHFDHLRLNLKREQMLEERYEEIDRHNRILLQKMAGIMRKPLAGADGRPNTPRGTLNKPMRVKELHRITKENQGILERIQRVAPTYNHVEWVESARKQEKYLHHACEYPLVLRSGTPRGVTPRSAGSQRKRTPRTAEAAAADGPEAKEDASRTFVFKRGMVLQDCPYLVEMIVDGTTLIITAYKSKDGEDDETLHLTLQEKEYRRVYREAGGDYGQVAQRLDVADGMLILRPFTSATSAPADLLTYEQMAAPSRP